MEGHVLFIHELDSAIMELKVSLEEKGIHVAVYSNPLQAVNYAKNNPPDIVITEILTKPVSGFETAAAISSGKYGFTVPVVFYTEFYRDERARRDVSKKYGAIHYFVKPFQKEALKKAILCLLEEPSRPRLSAEEKAQVPTPQKFTGSELSAADQGEIKTVYRSQANFPLGFTSKSPSPIDPPAEKIAPPYPQAAGSNTQAEIHPGEDTASLSPRAIIFELPKMPEPGSGIDEKLERQLQALKEEPDLNPSETESLHSLVKPADNSHTSELSFQLPKESPRKWLILTSVLLAFLFIFLLFKYKFEQSTLIEPSDSHLKTANSDSQEVANIPVPIPSPSSTEVNPVDVSKMNDLSQESAKKNPAEPSQEAQAPAEVLPPPATVARAESPPVQAKSELIVTDISGSARSPKLIRMQKPELSAQVLQSMGTGTYVIRVVVDRNGKVIEVTPINPAVRGTSLPRSVLDVIWKWEFIPLQDKDGGPFLKHYSIKISGHR